MKKFFKALDFLWENGILTAIAYMITIGWFAYAVNIIKTHGSMLGNTFFIAWALVLAFIWLCHKSSEK